ncbi:MAG: hypothetical protein CMP57_04165 [Flavobacteriales bacterium]|nr:hypothetical protein [Flavobacteriales bacterium]|tara:strand:+ start:374 stop:1969 length:1596 start_codon:yes stop_codon:yes gene_type:complete
MNNFLLIVLCFLSFFSLYGQEELNREVIDVVKDFRPKVMLANKIHAQPLFIDTSKVSLNLKYQVRYEEFRVQQKLDSLKPQEMDRLLLTPLHTKQLSFGIGNLISPQIFVGISEDRNTKSMYHAFLKYSGAYSNNIPKEDHYSHLLVGASMKKLFRPFILNSRLSIKDISRFDFIENDFKSSIFSFNTNITFNDSSKFYFPKSIFISSDLFLRDFHSLEKKLILKTSHYRVNEQINSWEFINAFEFQRSNSTDYFHWKSDVKTEKETNISHFILGLNTDFLVDGFRVFPKLRIARQLIKNDLFSYFELGGGRDLYLLQDIYLSNPYIRTSLLSLYLENNLFSNTKYFARIGLNGDLFNGVKYQVSATAINEDNFMHFTSVESHLDIIAHIPSFTSVNMAIFHAEIDAQLDHNILSILKGDFRLFDEELSYVPEIEIGFYTDYYHNEEWLLSTSFRYLGSREALFLDQSDMNSLDHVPLRAILDVNISLKYAFSTTIDFYLKGLNLLNEDYVYWQEIPILGRQLNIGAKYRF